MREYIPSFNKRANWHNQSDFKLKGGDVVWAIEPDSLTVHVDITHTPVSLDCTTAYIKRSADIKTVTRRAN